MAENKRKDKGVDNGYEAFPFCGCHHVGTYGSAFI